MSTDPGRGQGAVDSDRGHQRLLLADRYRLDAVIGRGGMGQVWRGWDELLGRAVAVKLLTEKTHDETATRRFSLEARTAAHLNDPHVVAVYDFGADEDRLFLVMELITGRSLAQELAESAALDAPRAVELGAQIAAGLAAAHRHGVIHRDIKPGNLLLDEQGRLSIADFGIARFTQDTTAALAPTVNGQVLGTVTYLSPERALGRPATAASDVYALGCVLYQLTTGSPPFTADLPAAILYQHVHTEPAPPHHLDAEIPATLSQYILQLLAKDPAERPTAEQAENWLRHWSPSAPAPRLATTLTGPRTRRDPAPASTPIPAPAPAGQSLAGRLRSHRRQLLVTGSAVTVLGAATAAVLALSGPAADTGSGPDSGTQRARSHSAAAPSHPTSAPATSGPARPAASAGASPRAVPRRPATEPPATVPAAGPGGPAVHQPTAPPGQGKNPHDKKPKKPKKSK